MTNPTVLLKTPTLLSLSTESSLPSVHGPSNLIWEEDKLIVSPLALNGKGSFPALQNYAWLRDCLERSPITSVHLDPQLPESVIKAWADICRSTGKKVYLNIPAAPALPRTKQPLLWRAKRTLDWLATGAILAVFSPLLLLIAAIVHLDSPGPILFHQWRVGAEGKLFRICKFRSMRTDAERQHHEVMGGQVGLHKLENDPRVTRVGRWLRKLSLDELPQLFNVMRGEMSLVGPRPWAIYDAVRIEPELQSRLNVLPGITGPWQVSARSNELDLYAVTCRDLAYIQCWGLLKDLGILMITIPKVLLGIGAY